MVTLSGSEVVGCGWSEVNSGGESQDFTTMARMVGKGPSVYGNTLVAKWVGGRGLGWKMEMERLERRVASDIG